MQRTIFGIRYPGMRFSGFGSHSHPVIYIIAKKNLNSLLPMLSFHTLPLDIVFITLTGNLSDTGVLHYLDLPGYVHRFRIIPGKQ